MPTPAPSSAGRRWRPTSVTLLGLVVVAAGLVSAGMVLLGETCWGLGGWCFLLTSESGQAARLLVLAGPLALVAAGWGILRAQRWGQVVLLLLLGGELVARVVRLSGDAVLPIAVVLLGSYWATRKPVDDYLAGRDAPENGDMELLHRVLDAQRTHSTWGRAIAISAAWAAVPLFVVAVHLSAAGAFLRGLPAVVLSISLAVVSVLLWGTRRAGEVAGFVSGTVGIALILFAFMTPGPGREAYLLGILPLSAEDLSSALVSRILWMSAGIGVVLLVGGLLLIYRQAQLDRRTLEEEVKDAEEM